MDPDSIRSILFMLVLVCMSAYFSATETAFSSFNRIRMKGAAEGGSKRAALVLKMADDYDRLLSTILVGNNIVNILLTTVATVFFVSLCGPGPGPTVSTVVSTVVVLIFGEISPKSLAKEYADSFVMATAPILRCVTVLLAPVNWLFSLWKRLLRLLFKSSGEQAVTEEELLTIVDEAEQGGSLNEQESDMIRRVIAFNDREAQDILIPRVDVSGIDRTATAQELGEVFDETGYSRLPVYEDSIDNVVGIVHHKDFFRQPDKTPEELMKPAVFIPPTMPIRLLLKKLQSEKSHLAMVTDEYGGTLGIVTMEDVLEELVGEIWDEHDDVIESIRPAEEEGSYLVLCSTELEDLMDRFACETACEATTVSGWVMEALGCIPAVGDSFTADGLEVVVTQVDKTHPEEIRVRPLPEPDPEQKGKPKSKDKEEKTPSHG